MEGVTEYVALRVRLHRLGNPLELADKVQKLLSSALGPEYDSDIEVDVEEHTGKCSTEYCGSSEQEH